MGAPGPGPPGGVSSGYAGAQSRRNSPAGRGAVGAGAAHPEVEGLGTRAAGGTEATEEPLASKGALAPRAEPRQP